MKTPALYWITFGLVGCTSPRIVVDSFGSLLMIAPGSATKIGFLKGAFSPKPLHTLPNLALS